MTNSIDIKEGAELLREQVTEWLAVDDEDVELGFESKSNGTRTDFEVSTPEHEFVVEFRKSGSLPSVDSAISRARNNIESSEPSRRRRIPVVMVDYMTQSGRDRCRDAGVSWVDLSGNAHLQEANLLIHVEGKPNRFKRRGRPANMFSSKSSRIARYLLMHPDEWFLQRELTEATGLSEGYTSRIVRRLEEQHLVVRKSEGRASKVSVRDPDLLLDTWRDNYDFGRHKIYKGVAAARSGPKLTRKIASKLDEREIKYGATGLGAAWLWEQFADFRTATFYLDAGLTRDLREHLGFREESRGANLWLVIPDDRGVFDGSTMVEGVECVHPIQIYLDLFGHPERAPEAAEHLRSRQIEWSSDD